MQRYKLDTNISANYHGNLNPCNVSCIKDSQRHRWPVALLDLTQNRGGLEGGGQNSHNLHKYSTIEKEGQRM